VVTGLSSSYTDEFKRNALRELRTSGKSAAAIAKKAGCSAASLRKWDSLFSAEDLGADPLVEETMDYTPIAPELDLHARGARVLQVFGPFDSRVMVDMPATLARDLFPLPLGTSSPTGVSEGVDREIEAIATADPELARSGLAGMARALALELENPYNSATAKAACAGQLRDTLARLRELAPPEQKASGLDAIKDGRGARLDGGATATD
jgi:hypothetical protein